MRSQFRNLFPGFCVLSLSTLLPAAEPVPTWLNRPILGPTQTLAEVQVYTENRVPLMPQVKTAAAWDRLAARLRRQTLERVVYCGEAARWRDAKMKVEWLGTMEGGPGYRIKKLRYEALPGLWIPALLYEPENLSGKVPVVLNVNGHEPTGKAVAYKQIRCINEAKRGMLALNVEWLGMGQLNGSGYQHGLMNQLDLCGTSGLAPFYLAMKRGLDLLLSLDHADRQRVAVAGLSGGGWQTIYLSALDPRVTLANPVAGYSGLRTRVRNLSDMGDSEQAPCDMATVADYTHFTAMRAPQPTLLTYNFKDDCCFASDHALPPLLDSAQPIFKLYGKAENLRSHVNYVPGTHNFEKENREAFYRMLGDHFYAGDARFNPAEIPSEAEIKTSEQLRVELPTNNATFSSLALALSKSLPRHAEIPDAKSALNKWQRSQRKKLRAIVHATNYTAQATQVGGEEKEGVNARFWQLKLGSDWTLPVVELSRGEPKGTTILLSDDGRKSVAAEAEALLAYGLRVLAVDLFQFGESKLGSRFPILVACVGGRPLGLEASQLNAVAGWSKKHYPNEPVGVVAVGARASLVSLVAAGLEPDGIASLELHGALGSLKESIEKNWTVEQKPEMFCFALLQAFDIKQLEALAAPGAIVRK